MKLKIRLILISVGLIVNLTILILLIVLIINLLQVRNDFGNSLDKLDIDQFREDFQNLNTVVKNGLKDMKSAFQILLRRNNTCNCLCSP